MVRPQELLVQRIASSFRMSKLRVDVSLWKRTVEQPLTQSPAECMV